MLYSGVDLTENRFCYEYNECDHNHREVKSRVSTMIRSLYVEKFSKLSPTQQSSILDGACPPKSESVARPEEIDMSQTSFKTVQKVVGSTAKNSEANKRYPDSARR